MAWTGWGAAALLGGIWLATLPGGAQGADLAPAPVQGFCPGTGQNSASDWATFDDHGLTIKALDGRSKLRLGGRFHLDAGATDYSGPGATLDDVRIRRAYIETYLTLCGSIQGAFQYDLADDDHFRDVAVAYSGFGHAILTVGHVKEPFLLDELTSDNNTVFIERSLPDALAPSRDFGGTVGVYGDTWTVTGGVFGGSINDSVDNSGVSGAIRVTYAPIMTDTMVLHLGIAGNVRAYDAGQAAAFSSRPEDNLFKTSLISTGSLDASSVARLGLEAAFVMGPLRLQGEYAMAAVDGRNGLADGTLQTGYVLASYVLNGKQGQYSIHPDYGTEFATFRGVTVGEDQRVSHGGIGVFQLSGRYSVADFDDGGINGGSEQDLTAGLNWYPDKNVRLMANYIAGFVDNQAGGPRDATVHAFLSRLQIAF